MKCKNPKCGDPLPAYHWTRLCVSCRYLARRKLAAGALIGGIMGGVLVKLAAHFGWF